jgi:site-specific DNA-adenine methylase
LKTLRPFFWYYGGKWRAAPRYPKPAHNAIVEPFAGSAGYALRYYDLDVTLIERYPVLAEMWRYLIAVPADEIRRIPTVENVHDLPGWVPDGARYLVGFSMNAACTAPRQALSAGRRRLAAMGRKYEGWTAERRERVAVQVGHIRHWRVIEGDYTSAPDIVATWFVDPPYNNPAGSHYVHSSVDYAHLAEWCRERQGQVIVCENAGADWLPFDPFAKFKPGITSKGQSSGSDEVVWVKHNGLRLAMPKPSDPK